MGRFDREAVSIVSYGWQVHYELRTLHRLSYFMHKYRIYTCPHTGAT